MNYSSQIETIFSGPSSSTNPPHNGLAVGPELCPHGGGIAHRMEQSFWRIAYGAIDVQFLRVSLAKRRLV